jgi:hypothetical protein
VGRVFLFALTAALNPTLLTATTVMLLLPNPRRLMLGYLAGALTTGIIVGVAIVEWFSESGFVSETKQTISSGINIALGLLALVAAYVIRSGAAERSLARARERRGPKKTPRWQTALSGGSPRTTFLIGLVLSFPGASYLASLTAISRLDLSTARVVLTVVSVNLVMLILLEVPLISFFVAPKWTPLAVERFKAWAGTHWERTLVISLTVLGVLFIVRGLVTVATSA